MIGSLDKKIEAETPLNIKFDNRSQLQFEHCRLKSSRNISIENYDKKSDLPNPLASTKSMGRHTNKSQGKLSKKSRKSKRRKSRASKSIKREKEAQPKMTEAERKANKLNKLYSNAKSIQQDYFDVISDKFMSEIKVRQSRIKDKLGR